MEGTSMTDHKQHPLGSGFTKASTADEVLRGIDLTGKNVIITGGSGRLGLETTRVLRSAGATVTVTARDPERATAAVAHLPGVEVSELDLLDPASIQNFATHWLDSGRPLHILINTAASPLHAQVVRDARGYEAQFATDHLGHFQLTLGLLPALRAARDARVVSLSSGAQRMSDIRWEDLHFTSGYQPGVAYAQAKTANVLFAVELDRRWAADGIRGYAVHPGVIVSAAPVGSESYDQLRAQGLLDESGEPIIRPRHRTQESATRCRHHRVRGHQSATRRHRRCLPERQRYLAVGCRRAADDFRPRPGHPGRGGSALRRPGLRTPTLGTQRTATEGLITVSRPVMSTAWRV
jgi:NAD(P)-dependent dehydrogenase (short-subunit alcohol dehydrogenase family)